MNRSAVAVMFLLLATLAVPSMARADAWLSPARDLETKAAALHRVAEEYRHHDDAREGNALEQLHLLHERTHEYARASEAEPRNPHVIGAAYAELERTFEAVAASTEDLHAEPPVRQAWEDVTRAMARVREQGSRYEPSGTRSEQADTRHERDETGHGAWNEHERPAALVVPRGTQVTLVFAQPLCSNRLPPAGTDVWLKLEHDLVAGGTRIAERGGLAAVGTAAEGPHRGQGPETLTLDFRGVKIGEDWTEVHSDPVTLVARRRGVDDHGAFRRGPRPSVRSDAICIPAGAAYEFRLNQDLVIRDRVNDARRH